MTEAKKFTEKQKTLHGLVLDVFPQLSEEAKELKEAQDAEIQTLKDQNVEFKTQIEKLENAPEKKVSVTVPGDQFKKVELIHKGYNLYNQGNVLALSKDTEKREILAKGFIDMITAKNEGLSLSKAINESTPGDGGYMVFDEYISELLAFARLKSFALQKCRVIDVGSDVIHIPAENTSVEVKFKGETIAADESNPTVTEVKLEPERLTAYSTATNEMLDDSEFDVLSWLSDLFGESIGQKLDNEVINGAASSASPFTGLIDCAGIVDSTGSLDMTHIADVITALPDNKSVGAEFLFHRVIYKDILIMKDVANQAVFPPSVATPKELWGYNVWLSESMPYTKGVLDKIGLFGNMKNYIIARRKAAGSLDVDIYGKFLENMTRFRTVSRWHGKPWNCGAFVQLING